MKRILRLSLAVLIVLVLLVGVAAVTTLTGVELLPSLALSNPQADRSRLEPTEGTNATFGLLRAGFGRAKLTPTLDATVDRPERGEFRALPLAGYGQLAGQADMRVVRMAPGGWGEGYIPREEFIGDGTFGHEDRFPTPAIFPKYSLTVE